MSIKTKIRSIPDFPKKGITFRDVSTLFNDERGMKEIIFLLADRLKNKEFDAIAGIEARGFVVGAALAFHLGKAFIMIRKPGKLPSKVISKKFDLEYGSDSLEIHLDAVSSCWVKYFKTIDPGANMIAPKSFVFAGGLK